MKETKRKSNLKQITSEDTVINNVENSNHKKSKKKSLKQMNSVNITDIISNNDMPTKADDILNISKGPKTKKSKTKYVILQKPKKSKISNPTEDCVQEQIDTDVEEMVQICKDMKKRKSKINDFTSEEPKKSKKNLATEDATQQQINYDMEKMIGENSQTDKNKTKKLQQKPKKTHKTKGDVEKVKTNLEGDNEGIKDEEIDEFCENLDEEDNKIYDSWIKLVEAKLHKKN